MMPNVTVTDYSDDYDYNTSYGGDYGDGYDYGGDYDQSYDYNEARPLSITQHVSDKISLIIILLGMVTNPLAIYMINKHQIGSESYKLTILLGPRLIIIVYHQLLWIPV